MTTEEHLNRIKARCQELLAIASCAGPAEAGWRATIAAIDDWSNLYNNTKHLRLTAKMALDRIITAWPEELLS